jgi:hypothetical protein
LLCYFFETTFQAIKPIPEESTASAFSPTGRKLLGLPCQSLGTCRYKVYGTVVNGSGATVLIRNLAVVLQATVSARGTYEIDGVPQSCGGYLLRPLEQPGFTFVPSSVAIPEVNGDVTAPTITRVPASP